MHFLIGVALMIIGAALALLTGFTIFFDIFFVGALLASSLTDESIFCDYVIANSNQILLRKRKYMNPIPFTFISLILTLGKARLKIVWKEEYFKASLEGQKIVEETKILRKEYISLRNEQRMIYSTRLLSREFMEKSYTVKGIGFERKLTRLIIASIFTVLSLIMLVEPDGFFVTLICGSICIPMILLWIPDYKDAKILQQAYYRALGTNNKTKKN